MTFKVEENLSQDDEVNASLWDMEHVMVILNFYEEYERKSRHSPNDVRRFLMDVEHDKKKLSHYLSKEVLKFFKKEYDADSVFIPLFFALIKEPMVVQDENGKEYSSNRARGVVGVYKTPSTDITRIVKAINEVLRRLLNGYPLDGISSFKIIIGKEILKGVKTDE